MVLPDLKLPEDHSHDDVLDYDTEINDAIDVFLKQKGHASTADLAVDNLLDQYGTPELAEQGTNTVTFQQLCDLVIKNKDVILANISKS